MEIERIEKVKLTADDRIFLGKVSEIMNDIVCFSEEDDLIEIASDIADNIKKFYEYTI